MVLLDGGGGEYCGRLDWGKLMGRLFFALVFVMYVVELSSLDGSLRQPCELWQLELGLPLCF